MQNINTEKKSQIRTLVVYGIILFMGALIILAMAIVSQIKVDQSEKDYQEQINSVIDKYATQQEEAGDTIASLEDNLKDIQQYLNEKQQALDDLKLDSQEAQNMVKATMEELTALSNLLVLYINEDYIDCLKQLDTVKATYENAIYSVLEDACNQKQAEKLYNEGVRFYANGKYKMALEKFESVTDYVSRGDIYDRSLCLMLLACDAAGESEAFERLCLFIAEEKSELLLDEKLEEIEDKIQQVLDKAENAGTETQQN
ncbi:MAG: hypothetical protein IKV30_06885 [Clostridia bacterium]|nr:hypothetical protein [Clostridia bacterium]